MSVVRTALSLAKSRLLLAVTVQGLHSAVTLVVTIWFLRTSSPEQFAKVSAYFLVTKILAAGALQWVSLLWLRGRCESLAVAYVSCISASITILISVAYLATVGLLGGMVETLILMPVSLVSLFLYYGLRRKYLLDGRYGRVLQMDMARAVLSAALLFSVGGGSLDFRDYLLWMTVVHLAPCILLLLISGIVLSHFLTNKRAENERTSIWLTKGESGIVSAWLGNAIFSQASILLAPLLIGVGAFAAVRAYEIFLVVVVFAAQVLDPIYIARGKQWGAIESRLDLVKTWSAPIVIMVIPILVLILLELMMPHSLSPSTLAIPSTYHYAKNLFWGVMFVSFSIAIQAPIRWMVSAYGEGRGLLWSTMAVSVVSLLLMVVVQGHVADFWIPIAAEIAFELIMTFVLLRIVYGQWRRRHHGRGMVLPRKSADPL